MRILFDIGHPGHVHYFRNLYLQLKKDRHEILITARQKEVAFELLHYYNMPYISRNKGGKSILGKLLYLLIGAFKIYAAGLKFKPDIIISFASPYASLASVLLRCKNIVLDDTEVGKFEQLIYRPLADIIFTPEAFKKLLGKKQFRFNSFMELTYLLPGYFKPDIKILEDLGLGKSEKYVIIRFISWEASHDRGQKGLSLQQKNEIIDLCKKKYRVFISSESKLPDTLEIYRLPIQPHKLHDALYYASLYIGEGATTASESCLMGTPSIYINSINAGTIEEQEKSGSLFNFRNYDGVKELIMGIISEDNKERYSALSAKLVNEKIDLTAFLVWFIENYPESKRTIQNDPEYQYRFK